MVISRGIILCLPRVLGRLYCSYTKGIYNETWMSVGKLRLLTLFYCYHFKIERGDMVKAYYRRLTRDDRQVNIINYF